jgi:hypothetical protein
VSATTVVPAGVIAIPVGLLKVADAPCALLEPAIPLPAQRATIVFRAVGTGVDEGNDFMSGKHVTFQLKIGVESRIYTPADADVLIYVPSAVTLENVPPERLKNCTVSYLVGSVVLSTDTVRVPGRT